jgi:hypothetical protein
MSQPHRLFFLLHTATSSVTGQHDVGRNQKPERIVTYERDINEHCNNGETRDNERNDMYAKDVEHRRCLFAPRSPRMIKLRWRSRTDTTTSLVRTHPTGVYAAPKGPSDSGVFATPERVPEALSSQFAIIVTKPFACR